MRSTFAAEIGVLACCFVGSACGGPAATAGGRARGAGFDRFQAQARACAVEGEPKGSGLVEVTFAADGSIAGSRVKSAPWTPDVAACVLRAASLVSRDGRSFKGHEVGYCVMVGPGDANCDPPGAFPRGAAAAAMGAVDIESCREAIGPLGPGHLVIRFAPDGHVEEARLDNGPFAGTREGACIVHLFEQVHVPSFEGRPVTVGKSFVMN